MRLRFAYVDPSNPDAQVSQTELILNEVESGEYKGSGSFFSQAGSWRVDVTVRREGEDDASRTFVTSVRPPPATEQRGGDNAFDLPFDSVTWNEVAGVFLIIAGAMIVVYRRELRSLAYESGRAAIAAGVVFIVAGGVLAFGVDTHGEAVNPTAGNPVKPTAGSIERGRMLFQQNCIVCHGADGRGDGPRAADLDPRPSDFRQHVPVHDDAQLFAFIANGFPGSAMPAWREQLSEEDMWNLVNFLRATFSETATQ